ncbi:hypothetical protein [Cytobacillus dafuensis]|uniref:Uncharacterized protein n=1 Tax=Cytobacillus dafuensis TaxID=1742359 RepID=A0A5B8YZW9_CYTDA|nr:hypothetical protein [Cytobacillus dafuensis]QED46081.1 hypothetical protein FSZ17_01470 [Cytobacillus dafuensis]
MKYLAVLIIILFTLSGCNNGYDSLEKAVQSQWKTPIEIINQDEDKQLVYYLDQTQHILGVYHYEKGKYSYDNEQSVGITFESESGLPFFISANYFEGVGNIIHGAIKTDKYEVERFVIEYKNGETQEIKARNNTFITEFPSYLTISAVEFLGKVENAYGYDKNNEIVESWN